MTTGSGFQYVTAVQSDVAKARRDGFDVVWPELDQVLLDLDDQNAMEHYERILPMAKDIFGAVERRRWRSKSGQGWHVVVEVDHELTAIQRVALQAAMGSDRKRELMATARAMRRDEHVSVLFKPPAEED
jgi:hypothetical protein